jgi:hypothetical protein
LDPCCHFGTEYTRFDSSGVTLVPFLKYDKNQTDGFTPKAVFLLNLEELPPDDKLFCPIRALKFYIAKASVLRGNEKALFITAREHHSY